MALPGVTRSSASLARLKRGDYVVQTRGVPHGQFRVRWWANPPGGDPILINPQGAWKGTYFGPVHDVRDTRDAEGFISVLVPAPGRSPVPLVWINVLKCKPGDTWESCSRVSDAEVQRWVRRGWRTIFYDE